MSLLFEEEEEMLKQIDYTFDKIKTLIKYKVWERRITLNRFKNWERQFSNTYEKYYAAYLARQLIYYNNNDFISLITYSTLQSFKKIALSLSNNKDYQNDETWRELMKEAKEKTLVCPMATDSAASSGFAVARILRDQNIVSEDSLCKSIEEVFLKIKTGKYVSVIFVDDMIGSGTQVKESYINKQKIDDRSISVQDYLIELKKDLKVFLAVAVAPKNTIERLSKDTNLNIYAAEKLTDKNSVRKPVFWPPDKFKDAMKFLMRLENDFNIPRKGFLDSSWAMTFEHGIPDNSSPFYFHENANWESLIKYRGDDN